jgi:hypothetical protein
MEEDQVEQEFVEEEEAPEEETRSSPALTINVHSWWTPIVGVVLLVVGLLAGYFLRPMITPALPAETGGSSSVPAPTEAPQPTVDPATRQQLMDFLLPQVKHFKGDANAPVTLIEFSDFQ